MVGLLITGIAGAGMYVMKLRSDNAILKANQMKLEEAVSSQKELIANQKKDFQEILDANNKMNELVSVLKKDLDDLDKRFNKKNRDVGKLAIAKTESIERITNGASALAMRCVEIASGSPLTEDEKNATKKSQINSECPSIANPNYVPYQLFGSKAVRDICIEVNGFYTMNYLAYWSLRIGGWVAWNGHRKRDKK